MTHWTDSSVRNIDFSLCFGVKTWRDTGLWRADRYRLRLLIRQHQTRCKHNERWPSWCQWWRTSLTFTRVASVVSPSVRTKAPAGVGRFRRVPARTVPVCQHLRGMTLWRQVRRPGIAAIRCTCLIWHRGRSFLGVPRVTRRVRWWQVRRRQPAPAAAVHRNRPPAVRAAWAASTPGWLTSCESRYGRASLPMAAVHEKAHRYRILNLRTPIRIISSSSSMNRTAGSTTMKQSWYFLTACFTWRPSRLFPTGPARRRSAKATAVDGTDPGVARSVLRGNSARWRKSGLRRRRGC